MKIHTRILIAIGVIGGLTSSALADSKSDSANLDSRWDVIAEANKRVSQHLSGTVNANTIANLNKDMTELKGQCNKLPKIQRASCLDDMMRLTAMAKAAANPDAPNRNRVFPTNIPNFVSPEMKKVMANWTPFWLTPTYKGLPAPTDKAAWAFEELHGDVIGPAAKAGRAFADSFGITTEVVEIGGVRTLLVHPKENRHPGKILMHVHGGAFYAFTPETTLDRTAPLADMMGITIASVDYKLMPGGVDENWTILDQRDQVIDVFNGLAGEGGKYTPADVGIYGCSAGGGLVGMSVNEMSKRGQALPAAAVIQSGMLDGSLDGDSNTTLRYADPRTNVDILNESIYPMLGFDEKTAKDPRYSTVLDNYEGRDFSPTMIQAGTKEVQMSENIRFYDVLRQAGHEVQLDVHDAMQHCFHSHWGTPEAKVAVERVAEWFEEHLDAKK